MLAQSDAVGLILITSSDEPARALRRTLPALAAEQHHAGAHRGRAEQHTQDGQTSQNWFHCYRLPPATPCSIMNIATPGRACNQDAYL